MNEYDREDVETAMRAADAGNAGHWPTVAGILHDEVERLRRIETAARKVIPNIEAQVQASATVGVDPTVLVVDRKAVEQLRAALGVDQ